MSDEIKNEPLFNIPKMTGALLLLLLGIHLTRLFILTDSQDGALLFGYSFIPHRFSHVNISNISDIAWNLMTMVTYMGFHIGWMHFFLNTGSLLAFGTGVEKSIGAKRMLGLFIFCGLVGVILHFVVYPQSIAPVAGASAAISGMFGAILRVLQNMGRFKPRWRGLLPITVLWLVMNVVFGVVGVVDDPNVTVAWIAHTGGFMAGLLCYPFFAPKSLSA